MSVIAHERLAIETLLRRLKTEMPTWMYSRVWERTVFQRKEYTCTKGHIRFIGVSRPRLAAHTRENSVGVYVPWTLGSPTSPPTLEHSTLDREWHESVLIRDPSSEERSACPFGSSVIRVAEAIDVISVLGGEGDGSVVNQWGFPGGKTEKALRYG